MKTMESLTPELLTTSEVAKLVNAGHRSVWRWSRNGAMPSPVRMGSAVRFRRAEIMAWIEAGCPRIDTPQEGGLERKGGENA